MARFTLLVRRSPYVANGHRSALAFAQACLRAGHTIQRVFFYQDAVFAGLAQQAPQGQTSVEQQWLAVAEQGVELQLCIANALRRGIFDQQEADRYGQQATLQSHYVLRGLGEVASAMTDSDRIVEF
ncbi:sulfurtransferase complex subunit TusD [Bacterioplanes sanyensis]|uniref:Sulfurtransferase complex subunit TusD n=1 Tax=Bacterioplanes sanyensis TaxID=1249553 RepID=A0A222FNI9_9GAMM|nr:sulfurtransferase complex subunit TusD [Bacterioplanes sanyensis]ASP39783.1 sulfurtransferase complex subunit TusD [Bacterioplanes sanyensis]